MVKEEKGKVAGMWLGRSSKVLRSASDRVGKARLTSKPKEEKRELEWVQALARRVLVFFVYYRLSFVDQSIDQATTRSTPLQLRPTHDPHAPFDGQKRDLTGDDTGSHASGARSEDTLL